ncbi:RTA1 domain protein [Rutstroemia sp. NJR-2017a BBW]|nr:RTA1 domain protein [Rutstroemia sp. NJR-2017a BBW]
MVMGRMVWNYVKNAKIYGITAWRFGLYFVILDVVALLVQILGAASATGTHQSQSAVLRALHIYMVGVGIQQFFICVFLVYAVKFHATTIQQNRQGLPTPQNAYRLLYAIYAVIILITVRIIFRLVEYSSGLHTSIPNHEAYQYCLDSIPMFIALVILNVYHPGRVMAGPASDIPSRKTRKNKAFRTKGQLAETHGNEDGLPMV